MKLFLTIDRLTDVNNIVIFKLKYRWLMLKTSQSLTPLSLCSFNECGVVNLNWFIKIQQCTPDSWIEQTYKPSSVCLTKAGGRALHGQLSEGLQHVDLHDYILHDHIFPEYNKPLMR